jgi:hypothetical protein
MAEPNLMARIADAGGCKDWFIDPIPVVNADGSTSPARTLLASTMAADLATTAIFT